MEMDLFEIISIYLPTSRLYCNCITVLHLLIGISIIYI